MAFPVADTYSSASAVISGGRYAQAYSGTALATAIAAMSSGSWLDYTGTNINQMVADGPDGVATGVFESAVNYTMLDWVGKGWFDPRTGKLGIVGETQGYSSDVPAGQHVKYVSFDMPSNTWQWQWKPFASNSGHLYDCNVSQPDKLRRVYRRNYNDLTIRYLDLGNQSAGWQDASFVLPGTVGYYTSIEVLPEYGTQGGLFVCNSTTSYMFDVATGARTSIATSGIGGYAPAHYVPGLSAIVCGGTTSGSGLWWKIGADLAFTPITMSSPPTGADISSDGTGTAVVGDPTGQARSWCVLAVDGHLYSIDWTTGTYTDHGASSISASYSAAFCLPEMGAILWACDGGRVSGATTCKMRIYKV